MGNALTGNIWYDAAGNEIKQKPAGSDSFTKTVYDGLGRVTKTYIGYDTDETLYADAVDGDTIFEQTETTYDPQGNPTWIVNRSQLHDATGTGELTTPGGAQPKARVSYMGTWCDPTGRQIVAAAYGTNGGAAPTRPDAPPTPSDDVLVSSVEYDSTGQAYRTIDAKGRDDRREFDAAGRVVRSIENYCSGSNADDKNVTVEHTYTIDGALSTLTAKNSTTGDQVTQYAYGTTLADSDIADARLLRGIVYPDSQNTFTMAGGAPTFSGTYNRVEFTYNRQGEQVTKKDQNETVHTFEYDLLGRQTSDKITAVDGDIFQGILRVEHGYEVRGMVEQVTSYDAATGGYSVNDVKFEYDDFGLLETDQQEHLGDVGAGSLSVQYARANGADNHTRLNTVTYPNGRVLHHEYSSGNDSDLSRVSYLSETNGSGTRYAAYTYFGAGRIVRVDCNKISDNDPTHSYNLAFGTDNDPYDGVDQFGRVVDLRWTNYAGTTDLVGIKHGYDRSGNRLWRRDVVSAAQATPVYLDELYAYDGMYQLTSLRRGQLNSTEDNLVADSKTFAEQWTLDPLGNWTNFKQDPDGDGDWDLNQNRTHNEANEIATIVGDDDEVAHDRSGNMTRAPKPDNWASHYHLEYDAWNRLVTVFDADGETLVAGYNYDALGRRVEKETYSGGSLTEIRHYYYSNQWQVLEEHVQANYYSGSSSSSLQSTASSLQYVWGLRYIDDLILRDRDADGNIETGDLGKTDSGLEERLYALQDPNWNVIAIANTSGATQERYHYDAYGKPSFLALAFVIRNPNVSSYSWDVLYTGRQHDPETGFYHCRVRPLGAGLGRFLGKDPIRDDDNPYRYVRNNPLTHMDPSGTRMAHCEDSTGRDGRKFIQVPDTLGVDNPCKHILGWGWKEIPLTDDEKEVSKRCKGNVDCEKSLATLMTQVQKVPNQSFSNKCFKWCDSFLEAYPNYNGSSPIKLPAGIIVEPLLVSTKDPCGVATRFNIIGWVRAYYIQHCIVKVTFPGGGIAYFDIGSNTDLGHFGGDDHWLVPGSGSSPEENDLDDELDMDGAGPYNSGDYKR